MKILDRYVLKEMLVPFLVSLVIFVVLNIGTAVYENMSWLMKLGVSLSGSFQLFAYKIPWVLKTSIPCGVLFATAIAVGRLGHDSELTAIRMAAVPVHRIVVPIFAMGILSSLLVLWIGESAEPWAQREFNKTKARLSQQQRVPVIPANVFFNVDGYFFYVYQAERFKDKYDLHKVMIYETPGFGKYPRLITAERAENEGKLWRLYNGVIHDLDSHGSVQVEAKYEEMELNLNNDIEAHLKDEEESTFPMIRRVSAGTADAQVSQALSNLEHEHDVAGEALARLRTITNDYQVPADVCTTYCALYDALQAMERDLHQHIHLENNILFPRTRQLLSVERREA